MKETLTGKSIDELLSSLESYDPKDEDQIASAMAAAEDVKAVLVAEAKLHSILNTATEHNAKQLIKIMFNRFHSTKFDGLLEELMKLSPSPMEPMRMGPAED